MSEAEEASARLSPACEYVVSNECCIYFTFGAT